MVLFMFSVYIKDVEPGGEANLVARLFVLRFQPYVADVVIILYVPAKRVSFNSFQCEVKTKQQMLLGLCICDVLIEVHTLMIIHCTCIIHLVLFFANSMYHSHSVIYQSW